MNKIFFKNSAEETAELFVYGEIVGEKWWDTDVDAKDVRDAIEGLRSGSTLNIYVNSPGGSVFTASAMVSMLKRAKEKGVVINAYIDGLAASAASFVIMVADNIFAYKNSIMMIHKPMTHAYGNALELAETIDRLEVIEKNVMLPLYSEKSKLSDEEIEKMIADETWMTADEMKNIFKKITILDGENQIAAVADMEVLSRYKHTPKNILKEEKPNYTKYEKIFNELKKGE